MERNEIRGISLLLCFSKQDRFEVACTVQHVNNFDRVGGDAIEDEVGPVSHPSEAAVPVTGYQRIGVGHSSQLGATAYKLVNKCNGSHWIIIGDPVADVIKIDFRLVGKDEPRRRRAASLC
jgi:hypothetical protein